MAGLNDMQDLACRHVDGPLLILAGAGSGKTRVITHRVAYLMDEIGVNPYNILAITFTNKAAAEMRDRVNNIVGEGAERVWVSTFHSLCVRILRRFSDRLGYATNFNIYDSDDQKSAVKNILKELKKGAVYFTGSVCEDECDRFCEDTDGNRIFRVYEATP